MVIALAHVRYLVNSCGHRYVVPSFQLTLVTTQWTRLTSTTPQAGVKSLVFGGRPSTEPMQGIGGVKGANNDAFDYIKYVSTHSAPPLHLRLIRPTFPVPPERPL